MSFNFPRKVGTGLSGYLKHAMRGCTDLILRLCTYDPDERWVEQEGGEGLRVSGVTSVCVSLCSTTPLHHVCIS